MWPSFNASTSAISSSMLIVNPAIQNNIIFKNTAWCNTILALSMGTCLSFMLVNRDGTKEQKLKIRLIIDCFINVNDKKYIGRHNLRFFHGYLLQPCNSNVPVSRFDRNHFNFILVLSKYIIKTK